MTVMILSWPDLSEPRVYANSIATLAQSVLTAAAVMMAIMIGFYAVVQRVRPAA